MINTWYSLEDKSKITSIADQIDDGKLYWMLVSSVNDDPIYMLKSD
jgi:hypothetical protein